MSWQANKKTQRHNPMDKNQSHLSSLTSDPFEKKGEERITKKQILLMMLSEEKEEEKDGGS